MPNNRVIIAAAGSRKTECVIDAALSAPGTARVLVTTYTRENQHQIIARIQRKSGGTVPPNIVVMGWFPFLLNECARPYQNAMTGRVGYLRGLNFPGSAPRYTKKDDLNHYFDANRDLYRSSVSEFACAVNARTNGLVVRRLAEIFDCILIDEVQDLTGFDLDLLDLLLASDIPVTMVGDPRQHIISTTLTRRHKQHAGVGLVSWFQKRKGKSYCTLESRVESYRCVQAICDFADTLFPLLPRTSSMNQETTGHDGVFLIRRSEVPSYYESYRPVVLREDKNTDTVGLPGINIGVSKGSTYDRVLIFPTKTAIRYYKERDVEALGSKERVYVAVTRARFSATFVE